MFGASQSEDEFDFEHNARELASKRAAAKSAANAAIADTAAKAAAPTPLKKPSAHAPHVDRSIFEHACVPDCIGDVYHDVFNVEGSSFDSSTSVGF